MASRENVPQEEEQAMNDATNQYIDGITPDHPISDAEKLTILTQGVAHLIEENARLKRELSNLRNLLPGASEQAESNSQPVRPTFEPLVGVEGEDGSLSGEEERTTMPESVLVALMKYVEGRDAYTHGPSDHESMQRIFAAHNANWYALIKAVRDYGEGRK
jgi:hypothetical protein